MRQLSLVTYKEHTQGNLWNDVVPDDDVVIPNGMKKPRALDLFCGCGGFSAGFRDYFDIVVANDIWKPALDTYTHNHKGVKTVLGDIRDEKVKSKIIGSFRDQKCDIVIGGPPCQGFSMAGRRDKSDPRNQLIYEYVDIIEKLKPSVFLIENVKGITSMRNKDGEIVAEAVRKTFEKIGYKVKYRVLNTADYGVPQRRERVIFIGTNGETDIPYPNKTHNENTYTSVLSAIQSLENTPESKEINHIFTNHSESFTQKIKNTKINESVIKSYSDAFFRLDPTKPSRTVKENHGGVFVHYKHDRVMTPRELARLQSFAMTIFKGTKSQIHGIDHLLIARQLVPMIL